MTCFEAYSRGKYIKCCSFDELVDVCNRLSSEGVRWVDTDAIDEISISLFKDLDFHSPIFLVKDSVSGLLSWTDDLSSMQNRGIKEEDIVSFWD